MPPIRTKIVKDENDQPVEVILGYEDWLLIQTLLEQPRKPLPEQPKMTDEEYKKISEAARGSWKGEDGLAYQLRIRGEWG